MLVEALKEWVAQLAITGLVLAFAEMVLPRNDLRRFARVVIGLVIVAVILSSLVDISKLEDALVTPSLTGAAGIGSPDPARYIESGRKIAEAGMSVAGADATARISRQIESLARLWSGAEHASADVLVGPFGGVEKVVVVLDGIGADGSRPGPYDEKDQRDAVEAAALQGKQFERAIRDFYGLGDDVQVMVKVHP